jgi:hypothetical protein
MSTERYQILSQLSHGLITDEEAERRLAQLGRQHRRLVKSIWTVIALAAGTVLIVKFRLDDDIRRALNSAILYLDQLPFFHYLHTFLIRVLGELL